MRVLDRLCQVADHLLCVDDRLCQLADQLLYVCDRLCQVADHLLYAGDIEDDLVALDPNHNTG